MITLNNETEIKDLIESADMALIYFSGTTCGVCEVLKRKITDILAAYPKIHSGVINGESHVELMGSYGIFTVPQFIVYVYGKETLREGRNLDLQMFEERIKRYYSFL